jgi:hypothetical protein
MVAIMQARFHPRPRGRLLGGKRFAEPAQQLSRLVLDQLIQSPYGELTVGL